MATALEANRVSVLTEELEAVRRVLGRLVERDDLLARAAAVSWGQEPRLRPLQEETREARDLVARILSEAEA